MGACAMEHAYVSQGGHDLNCERLLQDGVNRERAVMQEEQQPQSRATAAEIAANDRARDADLSQANYCFDGNASASAYWSDATPAPSNLSSHFADSNCSWNMGACAMEHAYVSQGGHDPNCERLLQDGVNRERAVMREEQQPQSQATAAEIAANNRARDADLSRANACFGR
jgi:hypothetical protein